MAKIYGALEVAQLEWFTDAGKPAPASYIYRVIYVSDLKQVQVSDGTNWIAFLNTSTNQTLAGDITFTGAQIFSGQHRLSVTTNSSTGAIVALAATTPVIEFTGAVTSIAGIASGASGATVMLVNRSGNSFQILDEGSGASATNRIRTGAGSITLANNASVLLTYVGDNRWHVVGGSGSGAGAGGSKNYFALSSANANFAQNTVSPWSAATLTLSGGVPTGAPTLTATQMAIAATATNPILTSESLYNMQLTKSAANAQGQGFISSVLTIDREDVAKVLTGTFSYEVVSGTIDLSGASTQSLEIWVYNVTANQWIQPAGFRGMNQSSGVGQVTFTFQTDGTPANVQYRIAVITAQTSASAYVVNFNDFKIGPQTVPIVQLRNPAGTIIATGSLTPPSGYLYCDGTAVSRTGYSELFAAIGTTYGVGDGSTTFNIPDLRGIFARGAGTNPSNASNTTTMGNRQLDDFKAHVHTSTPIQVAGGTFTSSGNYLGQNGSPVAGPGTQSTGGTETRPANVGVAYHICFSSGYVQLSNDTDTRVVSAFGTKTSGTHTSTGNWQDVTSFDSSSTSTHGNFNTTTGIYTVVVSGDYLVSANAGFATNSTGFRGIRILKTGGGSTGVGVFVSPVSGGQTNIATSGIVRGLVAGDILYMQAFQSSGGNLNYATSTDVTTNLSISRLSGPSVVAASETVAAEYASNAGNSIPFNQWTYIDFSTKTGDTHNAVLGAGSGNNATYTNTWRYVVPVSGRYLINGNIGILNGATTNNIDFLTAIAIDGGFIRTGNRVTFLTTQSGATYYSLINCQVQLRAGQIISLAAYQVNGGSNSRQMELSTNANNINIVRVGN